MRVLLREHAMNCNLAVAIQFMEEANAFENS